MSERIEVAVARAPSLITSTAVGRFNESRWQLPHWPTLVALAILACVAPTARAQDACLNIQEVSCATDPIFINLVGMGNWSNQACGPLTPGQENLFSFTPATTGAYSLQVTSASGDSIHYMRKAASGGCTSDGWTCIGTTNTIG